MLPRDDLGVAENMPRLILGQEELEFKIGLQIRIPEWSLATHRKIYN